MALNLLFIFTASLNPVWILELPRRPGPRKLPVPPSSATGDREQHFYNGLGLNPVCKETRYSGPCAGYFRRYYFDNVTKTCEKFVFGGCHANGNNFVRDSRRMPEHVLGFPRPALSEDPRCLRCLVLALHAA
ncbi:uncharacterized protein LOC119168434 isoform X2 [Rhipicephalus microplus]|uniref:uncharacterized protein LOC119168434 isoform X2 n=1 Tax=Rhipicephalus microplus TaxID=6941 RepID=UPI003F6CDB0F